MKKAKKRKENKKIRLKTYGKQKTFSLKNPKVFIPLSVIVLLFFVYIFQSGITGLFISEEGLFAFDKNVYWNIDSDQIKEFTIKTDLQSYDLRSVRLTGTYTGNGTIKAYLETEKERYLILDNNAIAPKELSGITGLFIEGEGPPPEDAEEDYEVEEEVEKDEGLIEELPEEMEEELEEQIEEQQQEIDEDLEEQQEENEEPEEDESEQDEEEPEEEQEDELVDDETDDKDPEEQTEEESEEESNKEEPEEETEEPEVEQDTSQDNKTEEEKPEEKPEETITEETEEPIELTQPETNQTQTEIQNITHSNQTLINETESLPELINESINISDINLTEINISEINETINVTLTNQTNITESNITTNITANITITNQTKVNITEEANITIDINETKVNITQTNVTTIENITIQNETEIVPIIPIEIYRNVEIKDVKFNHHWKKTWGTITEAVLTIENLENQSINVQYLMLNFEGYELPDITEIPTDKIIEPGETKDITIKTHFNYRGKEKRAVWVRIKDQDVKILASTNAVFNTELAGIAKEIDFELICVETCLLPDGLTSDKYDITFEVDQGLLSIDKIDYVLHNSTTPFNATVFEGLYKKVKEDPKYDAIIDSTSYDNISDTLTVNFHHTSEESLPIIIKGEVEYDLSNNFTFGGENITLTVNNWGNKRFRILVGSHTEAFEFGRARKIKFKGEIRNALRKKIKARMEFIDELTEEKKFEKEETAPEAIIDEGEYNIRVTPENMPVKEILFKEVKIYDNITDLVDLDDVPAEKEGDFAEVYAIDPTRFNFTNATVTVVATGHALYKCKSWDFAAQECVPIPVNCTTRDTEDGPTEYCDYEGGWQYLMDTIPGQEYTFTLTPDDPGFGEFDDSSSATGTGQLTWSHTIANNNDRILIVGATAEGAAASTAYDTCRATSVTYNGQSLTKITGYDLDDSGADQCASLWYMLNPPVGTANIQVTYASTVSESNSGAISLYGMVQQAPENFTTNYAISNPSSITTDITTQTPGSWIIDVIGSGNSGAYSPTQSNIERFDTGTSTAQAAGSTKNVSNAGTYSMGWSQGANRLVHVLAAFAPIDNSVPTTPTSILCDGTSCTDTFSNNVILNCSGSTDADSDTITYFLEYSTGATQGTCSNNGDCGSCGDSGSCGNCGTAGCSWQGGSSTSSNQVEYADFDSGSWDGWTDGGTDASVSSARGACGATTHSVELEDDSEDGHTLKNLDLSGYDYVEVKWSAYYNSLENDNREDRSGSGGPACAASNLCAECLEFSVDGNILKTWGENSGAVDYFCDEDVQEGTWLTPTSGNGDAQIMNLTCGVDITCDSSVTIKFEAELSGTGDDVYIDCIDVTGYNYPASSCQGSLDCTQYSDESSCTTCSQCSWTPGVGNWTLIGNHTDSATFNWDISGMQDQSGIDIRCRAIDLQGTNTYTNYYDPTINLTIENVVCTESLVNTSWTAWYNVSICHTNNTVDQERNLTQYDQNNCGAANQTFFEYQTVGCDACTPSLTNTTWTNWYNISACFQNDTYHQERNLTQYDANHCGEITNQTFFEHQSDVCDYCTPSLANTTWTDWINITECFENDTIQQQRNLTQYDTNDCGEITNQTFFDYQWAACAYPDLIAPTYSNIEEPTDPSTYAMSNVYDFNITWQDNKNIDEVILEFDSVNYSDASKSGNNYNKQFSLAAGTYNYRWFANDTSDNWNSTTTQSFTINKASSAVNLLLDGSDSNINVGIGDTVNETATLNIGSGIIELYEEGTRVNLGLSPLTNLTQYNNLGTFNVTVYYFGNENYTASSETHTITVFNTPPTLTSINVLPTTGSIGTTLNITTVGASDIDNQPYTLRCGDASQTNNLCNSTQGTGERTCSFNNPWNDDTTHTIYCRLDDGYNLSIERTDTFTSDNTPPTITLTSVDGDTTPAYWDTSDNSQTIIAASTETGASCRWGTTDTTYSSMVNECSVASGDVNCNLGNVAQIASTTYHISCKDQYNNEQTIAQNLDVTFGVDFTQPTTYDDYNGSIFAPGLEVTIHESDIPVGTIVTTYYCDDLTNLCSPATIIDHLETVQFNNRGTNYLRYYSEDEAGNPQDLKSTQIFINQLVSPGSPTYLNYTDHSFSITVTPTDSDTQDLSCTVFHRPEGIGQYSIKSMSESGSDFTANISLSDGYTVSDKIEMIVECNDGLEAINNTPTTNTIPNFAPTTPSSLTSANTTITSSSQQLGYSSTDADSDTITYYVYGDTNANPTTLIYNGTSETFNWNGLTTNTYYWKVVASDSYQNSAASEVRQIIVDLDPPATITSLADQSTTTTSIYWTWINPVDPDFAHVEIWINGTFYANVSDNFYNVTGLLEDKPYEIQTRTTDTNGNRNPTWVTDVARTFDSCVPSIINTSWSQWINISICYQNDTIQQQRNLTQFDQNHCGEITNQTFFEYQTVGCDYCTPAITNTTWSDWYNTSSCYINDTIDQERNLTQYDINVCGEITNQTFFEYQQGTCDFCTPVLTNTSWSAWINITCLIDNTRNQTRNLTQYDVNDCNEISNQTFMEYRTTEPCDYCTPSLVNTSWSAWYNTSVCHANDTVNQERNLTQYDQNGCEEISNQTFFEYQTVGCDACTPSLTNTTWSNWYDVGSCLTNDTKQQNRNLTQYDVNHCGEITNQTFTDSQFVACDYCTYSITNTTWSDWQNQDSCSINDTQLQNRTKTQYDQNYATCYAVTSLPSDLWNSGNNITYVEYQNIACDYCQPSPTNTTYSAWQDQGACLINDTKLQNQSKTEYDANYNSCYLTTYLPSDLWNSGNNKTHWNYQYTACNYCTEDIQGPLNTTCESNDQLTQYYVDNNYATCCAVTSLSSDCNIDTPTYDNQTLACDFDGPPFIAILNPTNTAYGSSLVNIELTSSGASSVWFYNNTNNETYSAPVDRNFPEGVNTLYAWAEDTYGNINSTSVEFTIDLTPPDITLVRPTQDEIVGYAITIDADITDSLTTIQSASYEIKDQTQNIVKSGALSSPLFQDNWDSTQVSDGTYTFIVYAIDTVGNNINESATFTVDNTQPFIQIINPTNTTRLTNNINLNITYQNTWLSEAKYNITNSISTIVQSNQNLAVNSDYFEFNELIDIQNLLDDTYTVTAYALDSVGYTRIKTGNFVVDHSAPTHTNLQESPTDPATYTAQDYTFSIDVTDQSLDQVWLVFNGTTYINLDINGNTYSKTFSTLAKGIYEYTFYSNDTLNNINSTTETYTIDQSTTTLSLTSSTWSTTYGTETIVNCSADNSETSPTLFRNGTQVSIPDIQTLPAGIYNYVCNSTNSENYSAPAEQQNTLTINEVISSCTLSTSPSSPQTYGTEINASCVCSNPEATSSLYRNNLLANAENNQLITLPGGIHNYICNASTTENYTQAQDTTNFTINKASSAVNLLLDSTDGNIVIDVEDIVNETAYLITGTGNIELFEESTQVNIGLSPITNLTQYNTLGTFNVSVYYFGNENYTASQETHTVTVEDNTLPTINLESPADNHKTGSQTQEFEFNASDNYYSTLDCSLYIGSTQYDNNPSVNIDISTSLTANSIPEGNHNWYINCTDGSGETGKSATRSITVDITPPQITLIRPTQSKIVGYNVLIDADITDTLTTIQSASYEIKDQTQSIVKSGTLTSPLFQDNWDSTQVSDGTYTFIVYATDTVGNNINQSATFTVDNTQPFTQIINPTNGTRFTSNFNLDISFQNTWLNKTNYNITSQEGIVQQNSNDNVQATTHSYNDAVDVANLADGTYTITAYALDSVGYHIAEQTQFIVDNSAPLYNNLQESPADPATYISSQDYTFSIDITDGSLDKVWLVFDGQTYNDLIIDGNTFSRTFTDLSIGEHTYTFYANDTVNNQNATSQQTYSIEQASSALTLSTTSWTETYETQTTINCSIDNPEITPKLYRNGIQVSIPDIQTLSAGTHDYVCNATNSENYSSPSEKQNTLTINKFTTTTNLFLNSQQNNIQITYPEQINATTTTDRLSTTLYRDGIPTTSPDIQTLSSGIHNYTAINEGNENYTASQVTYTATINKATSEVNLLLNSQDSNIIIEVADTVTESAELTTGESIMQLFEQGNLVNSGLSPISNSTQYNTLGIYNVTAYYPESENYTSSSETHLITVQDTTLPIVNLGTPVNEFKIPTQTQDFTFTIIDNYYSTFDCSLYIEGSLYANNPSSPTSANLTANSIPEGNNDYYINCTDASGNTGQSTTRTLTVDLTPPEITLVRPTQDEIVGYAITIDADITDTLTSIQSASYKIKDQTQSIVKSGTLTPPLFQDNWDSTLVADGTYTFIVYATDTVGNNINQSATFTVDNTQPFIQIINPTNQTRFTEDFNLDLSFQNTWLQETHFNITDSQNNVILSNSHSNVNSNTDSFTDSVSASTLLDDTYTITAYALDSVGYTRIKTGNFIVDNSAPTYTNLQESPTDPATYSLQDYTFSIDITDQSLDKVWLIFQGTTYTNLDQNGNTYSETFSALPNGTYAYTFYANDTLNNLNSTPEQTYSVEQASSTLTLSTTSWTETYETQTTINCSIDNPEITPKLYRNGIQVSIPDIQTLPAGTHDYVCNATNSENYSAPIEQQNTLTINKFTTTTNLYLNSQQNNIQVTYPEQINATTTTDRLTTTLYRNAIEVSNPDIQTLSATAYNYTAINEGNENYTDSRVSYTLTVNKAASEVNLLLNGNDQDIEVLHNRNINITAYRIIGENGIQLYEDGFLINSGDSPLTNIIANNTISTKNITLIYPETENYTLSRETHYINITNTVPSLTTLLISPSRGINNVQINVSTIGAADLDNDNYTLICGDATQSNNLCTSTEGIGQRSCLFNSPWSDDNNHTIYCRLDDTVNLSTERTIIFTSDNTAPTSTLTAVDSDAIAPYWDTSDNSQTILAATTETGASCRWGTTDTTYSLMSNDCSVSDGNINCNLGNVAQIAETTYHISCKDQYNNEQSTDENLDITFGVDFTAPTTYDDYDGNIKTPGHQVTVHEEDLPSSTLITTWYCAPIVGCTPETPIDNLETVEFNNRGTNYLRYYSKDQAGNTQDIKTTQVFINNLITPGTLTFIDHLAHIIDVQITPTDLDSSQEITCTLYHKLSSAANYSSKSLTGLTTKTTTISTAEGYTPLEIIEMYAECTDGLETVTSTPQLHQLSNNAPTKPTLGGPEDNITTTGTVMLLWYSSSDLDNDTITYYVYGDTNVNPTTLIYQGIDTSYNWTNMTLSLNQEETNYWKVLASDSYQNSTYSQIRAIIVNNTKAVAISDPADQNTDRNQNATYTLTIINNGAVADTINLQINNVNSASTAALNQTSITLDPEQTKNVELYVTDDNTVGPYEVQVTAISDNDPTVSSTSNIVTTVYGTLSAHITQPSGTPPPIYYEAQNVELQGYVYDELNNPISATVTLDAIYKNYQYTCSNVSIINNNYNCTLNTAGMQKPYYYDARINASKQYYHTATYTNTSVFLLTDSQEANLTLIKLPTVHSINQSAVVYNITNILTNLRGTIESTNITDINITNLLGGIGAETKTHSYFLTYLRQQNAYTVTLEKSVAEAFDPLYNKYLAVESNEPVIVIPENETLNQITLIKNLIFHNQTTTNTTYEIAIEAINSGDLDLTGIEITDTDIDLDTTIDLLEGQSWQTNAIINIPKNPQTYTKTFVKTRASEQGIFYSNEPSIIIPGYGGPFDVIIHNLANGFTTNDVFTVEIEAINQNTEIAEDRWLTTVIKDEEGTIYDIDIRTIYVGRNQSLITPVTFSAPSSAGTYYLFSEIVWPTATANATKSFEVSSPPEEPEQQSAGAGGGGGGGAAPTIESSAICGDGFCFAEEMFGGTVQCIKDCGYDCDNDYEGDSWTRCITETTMPVDVKQDIITLKNKATEMHTEIAELQEAGIITEDAEVVLADLEESIEAAEEQIAKGNYDWARNIIRNAYAGATKIITIPGPSGAATAFVKRITKPWLAIGKAPWRSIGSFALIIIIIGGLIAGLYYKREKDTAATLKLLRARRKKIESINKMIDKTIDNLYLKGKRR